MCRYVQKMTKLKSQITLKSQISKTLFLHEIKDLAKNVIIYINIATKKHKIVSASSLVDITLDCRLKEVIRQQGLWSSGIHHGIP